MAISDFTGQNIQDTYQRVVQTDSTNRLADGTGSIFIPVSASHAITASHALFAVSASHEITFELSSSHAQTADQVGSFTANAIGQAYDTVANNGQGNIRFTELDNGTDDLALTNLTTTGTPAFSKLTLNGEGSANDPILTFGGVTGSVSNPQIGYVRGGAMFFHPVGNPDNLAITFINQNADLAATIDTDGIYRSLLSPYSVAVADNANNATNATKVDVANDTGNAEHPITFIDDTSPDGDFEALKANAGITVNPSTNGLTLGQITASGNISASGDLIVNNINGTINGGTF